MKNKTWPLLIALTLSAVTSFPAEAQSIYTPYAFTNFAGSAGGWGNADGVGPEARFNNPFDVALDSAGNLYVADGFNNTIRKVTPIGTNWVVTTLAGRPRVNGSSDGTNSAALFNTPTGVALDSAGNLYVADQSSSTIRKVTPDGIVTTLAGRAPFTGSNDGTDSDARFFNPAGLAVDGANNIYVADSGNYTIRKIQPVGTNWVVTTIAGSPGQSGSTDGTNSTARFGVFINGPASIAVDSATNLYVADTGNSTIRKITPIGTNWVVTTLAGSTGQIGTADGTNTGARFYNPYGVVVDNATNLYVTDGNFLVRKVTPVGTNWVVTTLAGNTTFGSVDGVGSAAEFSTLKGLKVDNTGNLYVVDGYNSTIRMITPAKVVTTLVGMADHRGTINGVGSAAKFYLPFGLTVDNVSNVYIGDQGNHTIRKITPNAVVTTLAGNPNFDGGSDGTNGSAYFRQPSGLAIDGTGNIYVADAGNYKIRRVSPVGANWVVTTLAGGTMLGGADGTNKAAQFRNCYGLALDSATNIYVADTYNHTIRRVSPVGTNWVVTTLAGTALQTGNTDGNNKAARFYYPYGIAVDTSTNLYVADSYNMTIRKITPIGTNWVVTTVAGSAGVFGSADGTNSAARFWYPQAITIDRAGNLFVADGNNATIRRLTRSGTNWVVTTLGGSPRAGGLVGQAGAVDGIGSAAQMNITWGLGVDPGDNLFVADAAENRIIKATPLFVFDPANTSFSAANNLFHLRLTGPPGSNAVVETSTDLQNWTPIQTNALPAIGLNISLVSTNHSGSVRARLMP